MKMNETANITRQDDRLLISGKVDFYTAVSLWNQSLPLIMQCKQLIFDFSNVTMMNSAALSLLLEWLKLSKRLQKNIIFHDLPSQLLSIAAIAGIDTLLLSYSV